MSEILIKTEGLTKSYFSVAERIDAVKDVDIEIRKGE